MKRSMTKKNREKLDSVLKGAEYLELLSLLDKDSEVKSHFHNISGDNTPSKKIKKKEYNATELTVKHFLFFEVVFDVLYEIGIALRNCVSADYKNVKKSVRWILETILFWSNFQTLQGKSQIFYKYFLHDYPNTKRKDFLLARAYVRIDFRSRFEERIEMKREYGKPSFNELTNRLDKLKVKGIDVENLKKDLKDLNMTSSEYLHISYQTLKEYDLDQLRWDYAFFQSYEFDQSQFDYALEELWKVLDAIFVIMILTKMYFYNYDSPKKLLENEIQYYNQDSARKNLLNDKKIMSKLEHFSKIVR